MKYIAYSITPLNPSAHLFQVTCRIDQPDNAGQRLRLPNWIPGSYMMRDFARNIVTISAHDDKGPVALEKIDKCRWRALPAQGALHIVYQVYAWDLSVRAAHLDTTHGYFNGTSVFLLAEGHATCPCELTINPADEPIGAGWQVATSMQTKAVNHSGFGVYRAQNYLDLIDHPVEMGCFERHSFDACGVEHQLVLSGRFKTDAARICSDLSKICAQHIHFFGEPAPFDRYVFLVMVVGDGYGGLEHKFSTSLLVSRDTLPVAGDPTIGDGYLQFLGLCSHEYFHAWNVTRIRPQRLAAATLDSEAYTTLLWAFEGITSYYDDLALVRCGLITPQRYLKLLSATLTRIAQTPGRQRQSVGDSSFDAWTKFYKQDENAPNAIVSYYAKGTLVALALDLHLRKASGGAKSLDDLMRLLWQKHGRGAGVDECGIEALAGELLESSEARVALTDFFDLAVRGVDELPLATLLPQVGVELTWQKSPAETRGDDHSHTVGTTALAQGMRLAFNTGPFNSGLASVTHVINPSSAQRAGLSAGDTLLAIDAVRVTEKNFSDTLHRHTVGDCVEVTAFRRDELMTFTLQLSAAQKDTALLSINDKTADRCIDWLGAGSD